MTDHQMILIVHWIMQDLGLCDAENNICSGEVVTSDQCEWHSFISDTGAD